MEILVKIEKKLVVKIVAVISVILFVVAFGVLSPTFGNKITRVSYTSKNEISVDRINFNCEIQTKAGFAFKDGNITVKLMTERGMFEDTFDIAYYKAQKFYYGNYSDVKFEVKVNSYRVTGYGKYVVPAVIMLLLSGAGITYCIVYYIQKRGNSKNGV